MSLLVIGLSHKRRWVATLLAAVPADDTPEDTDAGPLALDDPAEALP
jgi:hypothetical protein